jgi:hypothetical protein
MRGDDTLCPTSRATVRGDLGDTPSVMSPRALHEFMHRPTRIDAAAPEYRDDDANTGYISTRNFDESRHGAIR